MRNICKKIMTVRTVVLFYIVVLFLTGVMGCGGDENASEKSAITVDKSFDEVKNKSSVQAENKSSVQTENESSVQAENKSQVPVKAEITSSTQITNPTNQTTASLIEDISTIPLPEGIQCN
ncbi:MAG: hypothetical protein HQK67_02115 [Desulfamplus sp.]|nr:hypothetical protein [Desulfamplus sp.]